MTILTTTTAAARAANLTKIYGSDATMVTALDDNGLTRLRRDRLGFVFQAYNLLPQLTASENITLPLDLARTGAIHVEVERYGIEQAPEAYQRLHDGAVRGRAVVVP